MIEDSQDIHTFTENQEPGPWVKKPSIKTITVKTMVNFLLFASIIFLIIVGACFRVISYNIIESKALAISDVVLAGLTSHMKSEIMDRRDYFLEEIKSLYEVREVSILLSPRYSDEFTLRSRFEKKPDPGAMRVFESGEPYFEINEFHLKPHIRAVVPYLATKDGTLNCLSCHKVKEGSVLGAVEVVLDLTSYRNLALGVIVSIIVLAAIFIVLLCVNMFRTIQIHIKDPLETLMARAKHAYTKKQPIGLEYFRTLEFDELAHRFNLFNAEVLANQELLKRMNTRLIDLNNEIDDTIKQTVFTMGVVEEQRSKETADHTKRVTEYCHILASKLGLPEHDVDMITSGAPLHDIGKLGVPDSILLKPGKLTDEEFRIIQNHPGIGYAMLVHSQREILQAAAIIAHQHHEKWDGTGYPQGLSGTDIHIYGRIVALADVFDALTSDRGYRNAMPDEEVLDIIRRGKGRHFDPALVDIFFQELGDFMAIKERYSHRETFAIPEKNDDAACAQR